MTPLASILTPPTAAQVRQTAVSMLVSMGVPANKWRSGGLASSGLTVVSNLFASVIAALVSNFLGAPFLPLCPAFLLPYLAFFVYGVTVNQPTYASGSVSLTNPGGGTYNVAAGELVVGNSFTGQTYTNTSPFSLGPVTTLTGVAIQANNLGSVANANAGPGAGSIDTVISTQLFAGSAVTVLNPAPVLGSDGDSPAVIRTKCLASTAGRSYKGPNGAYVLAIATAVNSEGNQVNINRWQIETNEESGDITVYLASPGGIPTTDDLNAVQTNITLVAEPNGITATAVSCTVVPLSATPQTFVIWAKGAGTTSGATLQAEASTALDNQLSEYPIGGIANPPSEQGYVYATWIGSVIIGADPLIYDVQGLPGDIPLGVGEVPELTSSTTLQVRQVFS